MSKPLGMAEDFYRLRLVRLDESDALDLDWRDDILYRTPPTQHIEEYDVWVVQAIEIADDEAVTNLKMLRTSDEAREYLESAEGDLVGLTRIEFEKRYFPAG